VQAQIVVVDILVVDIRAQIVVHIRAADTVQQCALEVGGIFSLVLLKSDSSWKIMHDHTSTSETK
jgi:hypothetical protein